jgi:hypothetical protein
MVFMINKFLIRITMKNICKYLMMALMSLVLFASCENFMDRHQEYLEGGEIIYSPKPRSIQFNAGMDKIEFVCLMENATNVKTIDIFYTNKDNKKDSLIIQVNLSTGLNEVRTILPNMGEKSYTFTVRTTDINGNHSLITSGVGTSYGDTFLKTLSNRFANKVEYSNKNGVVTWGLAPPSYVGSELIYISGSGVTDTVIVLPNETSTSRPVDINGYVKYRSVYKPEPTALDVVYGEWTTGKKWIDAIFHSGSYSIWFAGNGTPAGWDATKIELPFDEANPFVYVYEGALQGGEIKMPTVRGNWDTYTVRPMVASGSITSTEMQIYPGGTDLKWVVQGSEAGNYRVTINLNEMKIYFVKQ